MTGGGLPSLVILSDAHLLLLISRILDFFEGEREKTEFKNLHAKTAARVWIFLNIFLGFFLRILVCSSWTCFTFSLFLPPYHRTNSSFFIIFFLGKSKCLHFFFIKRWSHSEALAPPKSILPCFAAAAAVWRARCGAAAAAAAASLSFAWLRSSSPSSAPGSARAGGGGPPWASSDRSF